MFPSPAAVAVSLVGSSPSLSGANWLAGQWAEPEYLPRSTRFPAVTHLPSPEDYSTVLETLSEPTDSFAERVLGELASKWTSPAEDDSDASEKVDAPHGAGDPDVRR